MRAVNCDQQPQDKQYIPATPHPVGSIRRILCATATVSLNGPAAKAVAQLTMSADNGYSSRKIRKSAVFSFLASVRASIEHELLQGADRSGGEDGAGHL